VVCVTARSVDHGRLDHRPPKIWVSGPHRLDPPVFVVFDVLSLERSIFGSTKPYTEPFD
jgi:hypothetical protein